MYHLIQSKNVLTNVFQLIIIFVVLFIHTNFGKCDGNSLNITKLDYDKDSECFIIDGANFGNNNKEPIIIKGYSEYKFDIKEWTENNIKLKKKNDILSNDKIEFKIKNYSKLIGFKIVSFQSTVEKTETKISITGEGLDEYNVKVLLNSSGSDKEIKIESGSTKTNLIFKIQHSDGKSSNYVIIKNDFQQSIPFAVGSIDPNPKTVTVKSIEYDNNNGLIKIEGENFGKGKGNVNLRYDGDNNQPLNLTVLSWSDSIITAKILDIISDSSPEIIINSTESGFGSYKKGFSVNTITPNVGLTGSEITLTGIDLTGIDVFSVINDNKYTIDYKLVDSSTIKFNLPFIPANEIINIFIKKAFQKSKPIKFGNLPNNTNVIDMAIEMKKQGKSDEIIRDMLISQRRNSKLENSNDRIFGSFVFLPGEVDKLTKAGLSDDFINSCIGQKQYVTIGLSGIYLWKTERFVGASMIRILLQPRSFSADQEDYFTGWPGFFDKNRWDLCIGSTLSTSTKDDDIKDNSVATEPETDADNTSTEDDTPSSSYLLVGLSHEINKSAHINMGIALSIDDTQGVKRQFFAGVTLDSNILKTIGIIKP